MNALDYIKKNLKCFSEIISIKKTHNTKKDINANPFGVVGSGATTTRNGANKENYGGSTNTTNKN